jgi:hypothetical protein
MSGHRFRFRSPERDRETDERRFGLIRTVVRSAIADAEAEAKGLRVRIAEARRSAIFLVEHVGYGECAPTVGFERRCEQGIAVKAWPAQPNNRSTAADKRGRRAIADQGIVRDL